MAIARELDQWIKKLKCSGTTGVDIATFPELKVGVDPSPVVPGSPSLEPLREGEMELALEGKKGEWEGELELEDAKVVGQFRDNQREGRCRIILGPSYHLAWIEGQYKNDRLEGRARLVYKDGDTLDGFFKDGVTHGFARYFDRKGRLRLLGQHRNGIMVGTCWKVIRGGGCVVGRVDKTGELTGTKISYIYPDFSTALVGRFTDGVMQDAQESQVDCVVEDDSGIKVPVFRQPLGATHRRQIGKSDSICSDPCSPDPYESRWVTVTNSNITGAREGLFAKQYIEVNTTVAFYNGSRARPEDFDPNTWETNNYKIFDPANMPLGTIDIPVWAQSITAYYGSLAHKTNHSFFPNGQFVVYDHPKFGLIPCISTIADIEEGEEILVGYGYDLDESPDWYKDAWKNSEFGQQGINYKDWLECSVSKPISGPCVRG